MAKFDVTLLKDINTSGNADPLEYSVVVGNEIYFTATDGNGYEIWKTDGSTGGTTAVTEINATEINGLIEDNGNLFFGASFGAGETAYVYSYDISGSQLTSLTDAQPIHDGVGNLYAAGDYIYFQDGNSSPDEWMQVRDFISISKDTGVVETIGSFGEEIETPIVFNNSLYFGARAEPMFGDRQLYKATGTTVEPLSDYLDTGDQALVIDNK